jgi:signal transduction histidine kinase
MDSKLNKGLNFLVAVPLLAVCFFVTAAFYQGDAGFRVDKTQQGLLVSYISHSANPVEKGDLVVAIDGVSYNRILGFLLFPTDRTRPQELTILRGERQFSFTVKTVPITLSGFFNTAWPRLILIAFFLILATLARYRAPDSVQATLFFLMLCGFSTSIAATLSSSLMLLHPTYISASLLLLTISNWFSFAVWIHFAARFPSDRDIFGNRKWPLLFIYFLFPVVIIATSLIVSDFSHDFWCWLQRLRNVFLPVSIVLAFLKHLWDYRQAASPLIRNQIKLPLFAYWLTFTPYFFLYLLPNLLVDHPLISFRVVVFAFFILPLAYFIALLRYHLLDVDRLISRAISFAVLMLSLALLYAAFLTVLKRYLFGNRILSEELFLLFFIVMLFLFKPISYYLERWINRIFFRYRPVPTELLHQFSDKISATLFLADIVQAMVEEFPDKINVDGVALMLLDDKQSRLFPEKLRFGSRPWRESDLIHEFQKYSPVCLYTDHPGRTNRLGKELLEIRGAGFSLIFPMKSMDNVIGLLFVGFRNDGRKFSSDDIHLVATLANQGAIAVENAKRYEALVASKKEIEVLFRKRIQQEKMAMLGEMTAMIAHELKNPLGVISSSAQYLAQGVQSQEVQEEILQYILDEAQHLNVSMNNLLGLAKQRPPRFEQVDISRELSGFVQRWLQIGDHNQRVTISVTIERYLPPLYADLRQLNQVLFNLVRNSEEMMPDGGTIIVQAESDKQTITISVLDSGPGIAENDKEKLFKNFFTTKENGIGLGLVICQQIVQAHKGEISLGNRDEGGAVATICLPLKPLSTVGVDEFVQKVKEGEKSGG